MLVGRGVLRNPWILAQASDLAAGRPMRQITADDRARFLIDYMDLLLSEGDNEAEGFRHKAGRAADARARTSHERWVVNKMRALMSWYSKGLYNGGRLRTSINHAESVRQVRDIIAEFFLSVETSAV